MIDIDPEVDWKKKLQTRMDRGETVRARIMRELDLTAKIQEEEEGQVVGIGDDGITLQIRIRKPDGSVVVVPVLKEQVVLLPESEVQQDREMRTIGRTEEGDPIYRIVDVSQETDVDRKGKVVARRVEAHAEMVTHGKVLDVHECYRQGRQVDQDSSRMEMRQNFDPPGDDNNVKI